eukprot:3484224-Pyramimonas_sp.AAC.1
MMDNVSYNEKFNHANGENNNDGKQARQGAAVSDIRGQSGRYRGQFGRYTGQSGRYTGQSERYTGQSGQYTGQSGRYRCNTQRREGCRCAVTAGEVARALGMNMPPPRPTPLARAAGICCFA